MPILRRSSRLLSCWIIVFDFSDSATKSYQLVHGVFETKSAIHSSFTHGFGKRMPTYMNPVLVALKNKSILCSFYADTLWKFIGGIARTVCYDGFCQRHNSEESFIDKCIEIVCCGYISKFVDHGKKALFLRIDGSVCLQNICKMEAREKRKKRHRKDNYLGHFHLQMSFNVHLRNLLQSLSVIHLEMSQWGIIN